MSPCGSGRRCGSPGSPCDCCQDCGGYPCTPDCTYAEDMHRLGEKLTAAALSKEPLPAPKPLVIPPLNVSKIRQSRVPPEMRVPGSIGATKPVNAFDRIFRTLPAPPPMGNVELGKMLGVSSTHDSQGRRIDAPEQRDDVDTIDEGAYLVDDIRNRCRILQHFYPKSSEDMEQALKDLGEDPGWEDLAARIASAAHPVKLGVGDKVVSDTHKTTGIVVAIASAEAMEMLVGPLDDDVERTPMVLVKFIMTRGLVGLANPSWTAPRFWKRVR